MPDDYLPVFSNRVCTIIQRQIFNKNKNIFDEVKKKKKEIKSEFLSRECGSEEVIDSLHSLISLP